VSRHFANSSSSASSDSDSESSSSSSDSSSSSSVIVGFSSSPSFPRSFSSSSSLSAGHCFFFFFFLDRLSEENLDTHTRQERTNNALFVFSREKEEEKRFLTLLFSLFHTRSAPFFPARRVD